jgi:hypothetical protein
MALAGKTFAAAQLSSVVLGSLVPVLAWRLAADVAGERGVPIGRARTLALGAGFTAAFYLPLVLHSALPDSTMPFTVLVLAACVLMIRIVHEPRGAQGRDPRLLTLGAVIGLAAWTRNEAIWLALTWVIVAWLPSGPVPYSRRARLRMIAVVGAVAIVVFAPWAIRDALEFGTPFPGQALTNALSINGTDIFAWQDPPTLERYLAAGPAALVGMRVTGTLHNLFNVLLLLGVPVSVVGLIGLRWFGREKALRPLLVFSLITFVVDSLVFPVSTTWGTFLHAAGAIHVLLIIVSLLALDALIIRIGVVRGWTRPVAWLGGTLAIAGSLLFVVVLLPTFGRDSAKTSDQYQALVRELSAAGLQPSTMDPVISDHPIWLADTGARTLGLPAEPLTSVLDLARRFGARYIVVSAAEDQPALDGVAATEPPTFGCFQPVIPGNNTDLETGKALGDLRMYEIPDVCR